MPAVIMCMFLFATTNHSLPFHAALSMPIQDMHEPHVLAGLERVATCVASLRPVAGLQQRALAHVAGMAPHGCIDFHYKARRAGRMRVESVFYSLLEDGTVSLFSPPEHLASLMTPEVLVALSVDKLTKAGRQGTSSGAAVGASASVVPGSSSQDSSVPLKTAVDEAALTMAGSMRLTLSAEVCGCFPQIHCVQAIMTTLVTLMSVDLACLHTVWRGFILIAFSMLCPITGAQEQQAKQSVVLPYEHQGQGTVYQTGDWKDYLPESAGGRAGQQHITQAAVLGVAATSQPKQLGQIIYTRDSDDEDGLHDTDSDPDDDLDI